MKSTQVATLMLLVGTAQSVINWVSCEGCTDAKEIEHTDKMNQIFTQTHEQIKSNKLNLLGDVKKDIQAFV
jgi:hypothetical protein